MNENQNMLVMELNKRQINLTDDTLIKLFDFIGLLLEANQAVNLTAITDYREALIKHLYDSLVILRRPEYEAAERILDLGSGGGIPGIPLAICSPDKQFVSLDSTQKKINFQEQVCQKLAIRNMQPVWGRAEDFIKTPNQREGFDLALARAVAQLNVLAEITLPYVRVEGHALLYKGKEYQPELRAAENGIRILGGQVKYVETAELPGGYGTRSLITIQKMQPSPVEYPRKAGFPQKKPL